VRVDEDYPGEKIQRFDSEGEYDRFLFLMAEQAAGRISGLRHHKPVYKLHGPGGTRLTSYEPDFTYWRAGEFVVEDYKSEYGAGLPAFKLKRRWLKDEYKLDITVVIKEGGRR
jgi:hypothetical protein